MQDHPDHRDRVRPHRRGCRDGGRHPGRERPGRLHRRGCGPGVLAVAGGEPQDRLLPRDGNLREVVARRSPGWARSRRSTARRSGWWRSGTSRGRLLGGRRGSTSRSWPTIRSSSRRSWRSLAWSRPRWSGCSRSRTSSRRTRPHSKATHHLVNKRLFDIMKPSAIFVNTGHGPVVDEEALIAALNEGKLAGAGLDVLEQEPPGPEATRCSRCRT